MDKKLLLLGILVFIFGFIIAGVSVPNPASYINNATYQRLALAPEGAAYSGIRINSSGFFYLAYNSSTSPINFYIVNSSAFAALEPYLTSANALANALAGLRGSGIVFVVNRSSKGIYPYNTSYSSSFPQPSYASKSAYMLSNGMYYAVYANPNSNYTNVSYYFIMPKPLEKINSTGLAVGSIASVVVVIAGVIVMVFSIFRKDPGKETEAKRKAEVEELYKRIEKREKARVNKKS